MKPIARRVATLGLLILGCVSFTRLSLDYLPRRSFPELTVALALPEGREPASVARDWVEEIEAAIRSLGRVRGSAGEVRSDGAEIRVRFAAGTDPESKAARLLSELAPLRRRLPPGATLSVDPASQVEGHLLALVWLSRATTDAAAEAAAEDLRGVPGVRSVEALGLRREEIRVELAAGLRDPAAAVDRIRANLDSALHRGNLGNARIGDFRFPIVVEGAEPEALGRLPVPLPGPPTCEADRNVGNGVAPRTDPMPLAPGAVPLSTVAAVRERYPPPEFLVRYGGRPARALFVWRTEGASVLAADRALRRQIERLAQGPFHVRGTVDWSEAEPLRSLLLRMALGLLAAAFAAAGFGYRLAGRTGAWSLGLALPAGVAAAVNAFWLAGLPLDVTTLVALLLGATAALPMVALRLGRSGARGYGSFALTTVLAAAALPASVAFAGPALSPLLSEPARALFLAASAAILAAALPPVGSLDPKTGRPVSAARRGSAGSRNAPFSALAARWRPIASRPLPWLRRTLRDPGTAVLFLGTACGLLASLWGAALVPRPGDLSPDGGSFEIRMNLPEGATLEETAAQVRAVEQRLDRLEQADAVERYWSSYRAGHAYLKVEVRANDRRPDRLAALATALRYEIPAAASARIETGAGAAGGAFAAELEDRPEADEEALFYRMVLRGGDLEALSAAYRRILARLADAKIRPRSITGWDAPSVLLTLEPVPSAPRTDIDAVTRAFALASTDPPRRALSPGAGGISRSLVVVPAGSALDPDRAIPQVASLLSRPVPIGDRTVVPAALFALREDSVIPRVERQSGRWVVPIEVRFHEGARDARVLQRKDVDRGLDRLRLPAGVDLERPRLSFLFWRQERLRLLAFSLAVPLLLFAVAGWRLNGILAAWVALVPLAAGLLAATPLVAATLGEVDELSVLAVIASLCLALPATAESAEAAGAAKDLSAIRVYRRLRRETPWLATSLVPIALGLWIPTMGADFIRARWVVPLRVAAVSGAVALAAGLLVVPALRIAVARFQSRDPEVVRRRRHPPAWSAAAASEPPRLAVRSLAKTYASGHRALRQVSFELTPGITGLLGPNGAGKTTLLRLLTGLLSPTRGSVSFRNVEVTPENLADYRLGIGFLPQEFNAYPDFTAVQFLDHWARERRIDDPKKRSAEIEVLLAAVGLAEDANRKVRDFSGGMRQRVGIARSLLGSPPILIVDEPTTGLDIESRARFRQILLEQAADRIVLFSTHIASDIEAAASRILLIHRGRLRFDGTPDALLERARGQVFTALLKDADLTTFSHRYRVTARVRRLEGLEVRAVARPKDPIRGDLAEPNLEEAYLAEIERIDAREGRVRAVETFGFLG